MTTRADQMTPDELADRIEKACLALPKFPRASSGRQVVMAALQMFLTELDRRQNEEARLRSHAARERPMLHAIDGGRS